MHRVLLIDEILRAIFVQVGDENEIKNTSRRAFARLATVCHAWKDPALDFLWARLPSTDPLVALLPTAKYHDGAYAFVAEPSPEDLATLGSYASRVRSIHHNGQPSSKFLSHNLAHITIHGGLLFPALTTLSLHMADPARRALAPTLYLSTRLRSLSLDVGFVRRGAHPGESLCAFVDGLTYVAEHLERLTVRGRAGERILDAVTSMSGLRSLSLCVGGDLSPRALAALSNFARLQELRIQLDGMDADALREALATPVARFASLEFLNVRGAPEVLETLFDSFPESSRLHTVRIESDLKPRSVDNWTPVLDHLACKARYTLHDLTLEVLTAFCEVPDLATPPKLHFTVSTLAPLAAVTDLRSFKLDASVPPDLNDANIAQLARWWPRIEQLVLWTCPSDAFDYPTYFTMQPRATPASLRVLADACPALRTVALPMDIAAVPASPAADGQSTPHATLERITIGCVKKGADTDAQGFAACLHACFSRLESIEIECGDDEPWAALQEAYAALQT
ncbi:hypothetical protein K488DRAFT_84473 [Vararia minispora EC-137]|uniref:Uncharacterized protein n=1 Tax=Vararia minispora EC-137 TaxID=1314806 RepID=A0ACB8QQF3_9AGAM|nr:hypothetical protein K488DRAFT_84473 [Vararia minispora EC-137]